MTAAAPARINVATMTTVPDDIARTFDAVRGILLRASAHGLRLSDLAILIILEEEHPRPVRMSRLLDRSSLARQTANHCLRCLAKHVRTERHPALVGVRRMRSVAHYGLTSAGMDLFNDLIPRADETKALAFATSHRAEGEPSRRGAAPVS